MQRGLTARTLSQSSPIAFSVSAGRFATTTSLCITSRRTTSRPGLAHRVERQAALVAVHLQEHRAFAWAAVLVLSERNEGAILAPVALLHPDHLGAEIAEQRRAIGSGDIAAEIGDAQA